MLDATDWIERLGLERHPEGGYYAETYAADAIVDEAHLPARYDDDRPTATGIYYLLEADDFSAFHRLRSDEIWHFYRGDPLTLYVLDDGLETIELGRDRFQAVVPHDTWFAAELTRDGSDHGYALVGCTVTPGFHYADFELAGPELADEYPHYGDLIVRLTRRANAVSDD
ncbi:cupin domain-containing protein [Natrialba swarupiae]|uniref:Cupin domain-containing protein n=1 Tax=Natrialba swarupiae TaxID=2448032 RepID=A0A5D5AQS5_9EURY|nr:cupin domain-containing protein [Natrialba swarupiae]TYT62172.1 cupin domain-containing protein [Natrialba swarupiae]